MNKRSLSILASFAVVGLAACSESSTGPMEDPQTARQTNLYCKTGYESPVDPAKPATGAADANGNGIICITMDLSFNAKRPSTTPVYRYADDLR